MGHGIAAISIPSFLVLVGILLNQSGLKSLKEDTRRELGRMGDDMNRELAKVHARLDSIQADLSTFHRSLGQHDKAIEILEKKL